MPVLLGPALRLVTYRHFVITSREIVGNVEDVGTLHGLGFDGSNEFHMRTASRRQFRPNPVTGRMRKNEIPRKGHIIVPSRRAAGFTGGMECTATKSPDFAGWR